VASTKPNMAPFLVFKGCKFANPDLMSTKIYISAEQKVVLRVSGDLIEAIICLFFTYYICNLEYPPECCSSFLFMQREFLCLFNTNKVPQKVMMLMSELLKV
jgi:hypothetical protein